MILLNDFEFLNGIAENKNSLYNMITEELGLDEKQQERLVNELKYQLSNTNQEISILETDKADLEEQVENLEYYVNELEYDNDEFEVVNDELKDEIDQLQEENEELRNSIND